MFAATLTQICWLFRLGTISVDPMDSLRLPRSLRLLFWYASFWYLRFLWNILVGILLASLIFISLGDSVEFVSADSKWFL